MTASAILSVNLSLFSGILSHGFYSFVDIKNQTEYSKKHLTGLGIFWFLLHLLSLKYSAESRIEVPPVGLQWWKKNTYIYINALF